MDNKEIEGTVIKKALVYDDEQLLGNLHEIIEEKEKAILNPSLKENLDKILLEDYYLLNRLAK